MAAPTSRPMGIQDYLIILSNRFYVIVLCMSFSLCVFGIYALVARSKYKATNNIEVLVRSEEPLRQPLVRTTSFMRRFALMKRRLLSNPGLRNIVAGTEEFDVDDLEIRVLRVQYLLQLIEQNIREKKDQAERTWNYTRAPVNLEDLSDDEREISAGKVTGTREAYEASRNDLAEMRMLLAEPRELLDALYETIKDSKDPVPPELTDKIGLLLFGSEDEETSGVLQAKVLVEDARFARFLIQMDRSWKKVTQKIQRFNILRKYAKIEAELASKGKKEKWRKEQVQAAVAKEVSERLDSSLQMLDMWRQEEHDDRVKLNGTMVRLRNNIEIATRGSNTIVVSFLSPEKEIAAAVVNNLVDRFKVENTKIQEDEIKGAVQVLENEVQDTEKRVNNLRKDIIQFGTQFPEFFAYNPAQMLAQTVVVPQNERYSVNDWQRKNEKLLVTLEEISFKTARLGESKKRLLKTPKNITAEDIRAVNSERQQLDSYLTQLKVERAKLEVDSNPSHPTLVELQEQIEEMQARLDAMPMLTSSSVKIRPNPTYQLLETNIHELSVSLEGLKKREDMIRQQVDNAYKALGEMPKKIVRMNELQQRYNSENSKLIILRNNLKTAETTKRLELDKEGTIFKVGDKASIPTKPHSPNRWLILIMGFMVGGFFTVTMVFVLEYIDHSIKDLSDARRFVNLPILGTVSEFSFQEVEIRKQRREDPFYDLRKSGDETATEEEKKTFWERFKSLKDKGPSILLIISLGIYAAAAGRDMFHQTYYHPDLFDAHERWASLDVVPTGPAEPLQPGAKPGAALGGDAEIQVDAQSGDAEPADAAGITAKPGTVLEIPEIFISDDSYDVGKDGDTQPASGEEESDAEPKTGSPATLIFD
ncbi:GumC family protein [Planctomycetota bacterium]